jgi:hypothetical protein
MIENPQKLFSAVRKIIKPIDVTSKKNQRYSTEKEMSLKDPSSQLLTSKIRSNNIRFSPCHVQQVYLTFILNLRLEMIYALKTNQSISSASEYYFKCVVLS